MHNKTQEIKDKYGRQLCPYDNAVLQLYGAWSFNGRISTDRFSFKCTKCWQSFVGSTQETDEHQDGCEAAELQRKANLLLKITSSSVPKIEKQAIPIFMDELGKPIAAILYHKSQRVIYLLTEADEDGIIALYERKDQLIKNHEEKIKE